MAFPKHNNQFPELLKTILAFHKEYLDLAELLKNAAVLSEQKENYFDAVRFYLEALESNPNSVETYGALSNLLKKLGMYDSARECRFSRIPKELLNSYLGAYWLEASHSDLTCAETLFFKSVTQDIPVIEIENGYCYSGDCFSAVFAPGDVLVSDYSTGNIYLPAASKKKFPLVNLPNNILFVGVSFPMNYFHWMLEVIPRISISLDYIKKDSSIQIGLFSLEYPFHTESLEMLGVGSERIFQTSIFPYVRAKKISIPKPCALYHSSETSITTSRWGCFELRHKLLPFAASDKNFPKRFYIVRENVSRGIKNNEELEASLAENNIASLKLENMSLKEQIALFKGADVIIAPHGAGLTNLVFCENSPTIIEICPHNVSETVYSKISEYIGNKHILLSGNLENNNDESFSVDISSVKQYLRNI